MTCCTLTKSFAPDPPPPYVPPPAPTPPPYVPPAPSPYVPPTPVPPNIPQSPPSSGCTTQSCCMQKLLAAQAANPHLNIVGIKCP